MSHYYFYLYSSLANALSATFFGLYVYLKNEKKLINRSFALMSMFIAIWSMGLFFCHLCKDRNTAVFFNRFMVHGGAIFIPVSYFRFILIYLKKWKEKRKIFLFALANGLFLSLFVFSPYLIKEMRLDSFYRFWPSPGPVYPLFLIHFIGFSLYPVYLLLKDYPNQVGFKRNQIKYIILGTLIALGGGCSNYFMFYDIPIHPFGQPLVSLYPLVLGYAVARYRLMDIKVVINKTAFYLVLIGSLLFIHTLLIQFLGPAVGDIPAILFSMGLLTIVLLSPLKDKIAKTMDDIIYRGKYDYEKVLKESIKVLISKTNLQQVLDSFVKIIAKNLSVSKVSLFLEDEGTGNYELKASYGFKNERRVFRLREDSDTIAWLKNNKKPFVREELERLLSDDSFRNVYNGLFKIKAELVIPIFYREHLEGLLILDYKKSKEIYTDRDLVILESVASEAAIAIENAKLYERITIDSYTNLYNYDYLRKRLQEEIEKTERTLDPFALVAIELIYLDSSFVHERAKNIKRLSSLMKGAIRSVDIPSYSKGVFYLLFPDSSRQMDQGYEERLTSYVRGIGSVGDRLRSRVIRALPLDLTIGGLIVKGKDRRLTHIEIEGEAFRYLEEARQRENRTCIFYNGRDIDSLFSTIPDKEILSVASLRVDIYSHKVFLNNEEIQLTPKEFDLLRYFIKRKGRLLERSVLMDSIWGYEYIGTTHTVDVHVARLRKKLGPLGDSIKTIESLGYQFVPPEEETA